MLRDRHGRGLQLAVVSANPVENCQRILGPDLDHLMAGIDGGASLFGKRRRIHRMLGRLGVRPSQAIHVGDQLSDAEAARASKADTRPA